MVLIESDWNLKMMAKAVIESMVHSINRIRLEFKVY